MCFWSGLGNLLEANGGSIRSACILLQWGSLQHSDCCLKLLTAHVFLCRVTCGNVRALTSACDCCFNWAMRAGRHVTSRLPVFLALCPTPSNHSTSCACFYPHTGTILAYFGHMAPAQHLSPSNKISWEGPLYSYLGQTRYGGV